MTVSAGGAPMHQYVCGPNARYCRPTSYQVVVRPVRHRLRVGLVVPANESLESLREFAVWHIDWVSNQDCSLVAGCPKRPLVAIVHSIVRQAHSADRRRFRTRLLACPRMGKRRWQSTPTTAQPTTRHRSSSARRICASSARQTPPRTDLALRLISRCTRSRLTT